MKLRRVHRITAGAICVMLMAAVLVLAFFATHQDIEGRRTHAKVDARCCTEELLKDFQRVSSITETLRQILIDNDGTIKRFDTVAGNLMEDDIISIQLAPSGTISDIYPADDENSVVEQFDLMSDPYQGPVLRYAEAHELVTMQGPFGLKQGGEGIAIRNPVFLSDQNGERKFWGFTTVVVRVPDFYGHTLDSLAALGYDYSLSATVSPLSDASKQVATSLERWEAFRDPVSETLSFGGCTMTLSIELEEGWSSEKAWIFITAGLIIAFLILLSTFMLVTLLEQSGRLREKANTDELTGLLNRRGFMEQMEERLKQQPSLPAAAAFIDIDEFKQINDIYGHLIGDEVLKDLARVLRDELPEGSLIGRTGGDEFCALIYEETPGSAAQTVRDLVVSEKDLLVGAQTFFYTISAGYTDYPGLADNMTLLLKQADDALYSAKLAGKHTSRHYEASMSGIKRSRLGFSIKDMTEGIPGAILIYKAYGDEEILYANDELIEMLGCTDFDDFLQHTGSSFRRFVHEEDIERVEKEIWRQIARKKELAAKNKKEKLDDYVEYRIRTKSGDIVEVADIGRLINNEDYGDLFFVLLREASSWHDKMKFC